MRITVSVSSDLIISSGWFPKSDTIISLLIVTLHKVFLLL